MPNQYETPIADDFWAACDRTGGADACWPWLRSRVPSGYGRLFVKGAGKSAHRHAYELANGPIPVIPGYHGSVVMHTCDNRACVNPRHLHLGTQADNNRDRDQKGRCTRPRGECSGQAKLTTADVLNIRAALARGESLRVVAREFGITFGNVSKIKNGRNWGWLAGDGIGAGDAQ